MSDFATTMELAAEAGLECLDAEIVTYTPRVGAARSVSAIVHRDYPIQLADGVTTVTSIQFRNHATLGVLASAVDTGGDRIAYAPKRGGSAKSASILRILHQDGGWVVLEVD